MSYIADAVTWCFKLFAFYFLFSVVMAGIFALVELLDE